MRAKLFSALAVIGLFTSCEDPTDIGVGIDPASDQIGVTYIDTVPVEASTLLLDSVNTSKASTTTYISTLLVGAVDETGTNSPFKKVSAEAYSELAFRSTAPDFSGTITSVNVELSLQCTYVQGQGPLNLEVRRLKTPLGDSNYYGFSTHASSPAVLGSATIDAVKLGQIKTDLKDVTKRPSIIIPIRSDSGFFNADSLNKVDFSTSDVFRAIFKGISVSGSGSNAAIGFGASGTSLGDSTFVRVRYKKDGVDKKYLFNLSGRRFHHIDPQWSGDITPPLTPSSAGNYNNYGDTLNSSATGDQVFMQSGTGLRVLVRFPTLKELRTTLGDIAINKAELIVPVEKEANSSSFSAPPDLLITEASRKEINFRRRVLIAKSGSSDLYLGTDSNPNSLQISKFVEPTTGGANGYYKIQLTNYLQSVLYGNKQNNGLILFGLGYSARLDRAKVLAPVTPGDPNRMRLKIYYTRIK